MNKRVFRYHAQFDGHDTCSHEITKRNKWHEEPDVSGFQHPLIYIKNKSNEEHRMVFKATTTKEEVISFLEKGLKRKCDISGVIQCGYGKPLSFKAIEPISAFLDQCIKEL